MARVGVPAPAQPHLVGVAAKLEAATEEMKKLHSGMLALRNRLFGVQPEVAPDNPKIPGHEGMLADIDGLLTDLRHEIDAAAAVFAELSQLA